jgi:hypothetical protein
MEVKIEPARTKEADADRLKASAKKDHIPGWGYDADPENDPTYPMKHWSGADHERFNYQKPPQQPVDIEVFHSTERPGISRVFGTSTPPAGLSGAIRRYAYQYSESTYMHWVPLVLADRIDVVRGIIDDLKNGIVPNIFAEKGWGAEWKYNKKAFVTRIAIRVAVATAIVLLLSRKRKKSFSLA